MQFSSGCAHDKNILKDIEGQVLEIQEGHDYIDKGELTTALFFRTYVT